MGWFICLLVSNGLVFLVMTTSTSNQWKLSSALCGDKEKLITAQSGVEYFCT